MPQQVARPQPVDPQPVACLPRVGQRLVVCPQRVAPQRVAPLQPVGCPLRVANLQRAARLRQAVSPQPAETPAPAVQRGRARAQLAEMETRLVGLANPVTTARATVATADVAKSIQTAE